MRKVLIVEDDKLIKRIFSMFINELGHELVAVCEDSAEAIEACRIHEPDVVLMDIHINGEVDGIQTTEKLSRELDIPVIYVSSDTSTEVIKRAIYSNSYGFLVKPIKKQELGISIDLAYYKHKVDVEQKRRERSFREFISDSPVPTVIIRGGNIQYLNRMALELFKTTYIEDVLGLPFTSFVNDCDKDVVEKIIFNESRDDKWLKKFQMGMKTVHGDLFNVSVTGSEVKFAGQHSIQFLINDTSEEELKKSRYENCKKALLSGFKCCFILNSKMDIIEDNLTKMECAESVGDAVACSKERLLAKLKDGGDEFIFELPIHARMKEFKVFVSRNISETPVEMVFVEV